MNLKIYQFNEENFVKNMRKLRISQNLTQKDLSEISGIPVRTISRIESGSDSSFYTVAKLLSALGRDRQLNELVELPNDPFNKQIEHRARFRKSSKTACTFKWGDEKC